MLEKQRVGVITSKMLPLCKVQCRPAVKQFINKYVLRAHKQGKILYQIEGTKYTFTREDFLRFMDVQAIIPINAWKKTKTEQSTDEATQYAQQASVADFEFQQPLPEVGRVEKLNKTSAMEAIKLAKPRTEASAKILSSYTKNLDNTTFFDQATPEFSIEEPKASGLMEKRDSLIGKIDGLFDRFGFKLKNKIVSAVSGTEAE